MKAKLTIDWDVWRCSKLTNSLAKGTEMDIVPHMEADAESAINRPEGMCYLCKLNDGTCAYIPAIYLEITDWDCIDWEQRRYEAAKDMLAAIESNSNPQMFVGNPDEQVKWAIMFADELIKQLKDQSMKGCKSDESSVEDWTPSIGSTFYFVDSTGEIAEGRLLDSKYDEKIVQSGNRFKTREAAQPYAEKFKAIFRPGKR